MKNIILIVEDKIDEQQKAKKVVLEAGFKVIIADNLKKAEVFLEKFRGKLRGVITDIHFSLEEGRSDEEANGISVIISSLQFGISCSVCTDDKKHGGEYIVMIVERLEKFCGNSIPVAGSKDWQIALRELIDNT